MQTIGYQQYILLALLLSIWCALHSALISLTVTEYIKQHATHQYRYYRLGFNVFALLSLIPVILYKYSLQTATIIDWTEDLRPVQITLIGVSLILFYLGTRKYDARRFFGLSQLTETESSIGITQSGALDTSGILSIIRHPWYTALLLLLWARPMDISTLILNIVFTAYLFIGAYLEERKLLNEFGDAYKQYRQNVSMIIPVKWLVKKIF